MNESLGSRLAKLIDQHHITCYQLAKAIGVHQSVISRIINGQTKHPQISTLAAIARFFNIPLGKLTGKDELPDLIQPVVASPARLVPLLAHLDDLLTWRPSDTVEEYINSPWRGEGDFIAVRAEDSALSPAVRYGDILYLKLLDNDERGLVGFKDNLICAGVAEDSDGTQRVVVRSTVNGGKNCIWLRATNPEWPGEKDVRCKFILAVAHKLGRDLV